MRRLLACLMMMGLAAPAWSLPPGSGASDPSIVIGVVATLTGPGALASQDMVDGFTLGLRQLGGRFSNQEVRVVITDDKGSPDTARQLVKRLIERDRLDMVVTAVSPAALAAIAQPLTDSRLFVINLDRSPAAFAGPQCNPWLFNMAPLADGAHEAMGQYLAAEHMRRLVVVGPDMAQTDEAVAALKRTFPGDVAAVLKVKPGAATFPRELDLIAQATPDAVYSLLTGGMGVGFLRAWGGSALKGQVPVFPVAATVERQLLPAIGDGAADLISIGIWSPDLDSPPTRRLNADYESEYGRPVSTWATQGYDAAFLLDGALRATNGKTGDSEALRAGLRRADFVSARGSFKFNTNHFPTTSYVVRKVVRDAKGRLTHETKGLVLKDWRDRLAPGCPMRWVEEPLPVVVKKP